MNKINKKFNIQEYTKECLTNVIEGSSIIYLDKHYFVKKVEENILTCIPLGDVDTEIKINKKDNYIVVGFPINFE